MINLQQHFLVLLQALRIGDKTAFLLWQNLQAHYNQTHRHYHNLDHIKALYEHFERVKCLLNNPQAVALAIFYHDVIYDPKKSDNEVQSVNFLQNQLGQFLTKTLLSKVGELILATQHHTLNNPKNMDLAYFLDMDLAILGSDKAVYDSYAHAIRQEYLHFCDKDYQKGRTAVLKNFLQRPRLFFSELFFERYEVLARKNLQAEIATLNAE